MRQYGYTSHGIASSISLGVSEYKHSRSADELFLMQLDLFTKISLSRAASSDDLLKIGEPLMRIARWKSPFAAGAARSARRDVAPEL